MPISYKYLGKQELLNRLSRLDEALDGGSQTGVGIEMRLNHTVAAKSDGELRVRRDEYAYALFQIAQESRDPVMIAQFPNPYNRAGTTRINFGGEVGGFGYPETG